MGISYGGGNSAGGTSDHAGLTNLDWTNSGHTGDAETFSAIDSGGNPVNLTYSDVRAALSTPKMWQKTTAPTVNDDSADGYAVGDLWNDTTNNLTYIADSVAIGAADWRSLLKPCGTLAFLSAGAWYATAVGIDANNGNLIRIGNPVAMTQEGTSYSPTISGTDISFTAAGIGTGNTGAIQSNSMRWGIALSSLGISLSATNKRWVRLQHVSANITDNSEVRVGTLDLVSWLGVGTTTALVGAGTYRPISGVNYGGDYFQAAATGFNSMGTNANTRGCAIEYGLISSSSQVHYKTIDSGSNYVTGAGNASGAAISASMPTHLVVAARAPLGASGGKWENPRFLWLFLPDTSGSGI